MIDAPVGDFHWRSNRWSSSASNGAVFATNVYVTDSLPLGTKRTMPGFIGASGTPSITARNLTGPPLTVSVAVSLTSCRVHFVIPSPGTSCHFVPEIEALVVFHFADWRSAAPLKF